MNVPLPYHIYVALKFGTIKYYFCCMDESLVCSTAHFEGIVENTVQSYLLLNCTVLWHTELLL